MTWMSSIPFMPSFASSSATRPMSQVTLNALSIPGLLSLVANVSARASKIVIVDAPSLILPVTILHRYLASIGPESCSMLERIFILSSWESLPSAVSIWERPLITLAKVRGSENSVICFFLPMSISATVPGSPSFSHSSSTLESGVPDVNAMALRISLSAMPNSI